MSQFNLCQEFRGKQKFVRPLAEILCFSDFAICAFFNSAQKKSCKKNICQTQWHIALTVPVNIREQEQSSLTYAKSFAQHGCFSSSVAFLLAHSSSINMSCKISIIELDFKYPCTKRLIKLLRPNSRTDHFASINALFIFTIILLVNQNCVLKRPALLLITDQKKTKLFNFYLI